MKLVPEEERNELKEKFESRERREKRPWKEKRGEQAGGFSGLVGLGVLIKIAVDGFWLVPFSAVSIDYFLGAWLEVIGWISLIIGVPAILFAAFIMLHKKK
jgi:hypothetical protein